jgi:hypothetical protein
LDSIIVIDIQGTCPFHSIPPIRRDIDHLTKQLKLILHSRAALLPFQGSTNPLGWTICIRSFAMEEIKHVMGQIGMDSSDGPLLKGIFQEARGLLNEVLNCCMQVECQYQA